MDFTPPPAPGLDWSSRYLFSDSGLDRRSDLRLSVKSITAAFEDPRMRLLAFHGDRIPIKAPRGGRPEPRAYLIGPEARALSPELGESVFLGLAGDGTPWFAGEFVGEPDPEPDESFSDLRSLAISASVDPATYGPAAQARAMLFWHHRHRFCGVCGAPTRSEAAGYQRVCEACGTIVFPRIDPVVIMLIADGDRALLGRTPRFEAGMYTCLAGFMEPGETVEDAVRREVREESAVIVGPVRYHASQPWPFPANLMLGCFGEAATTDIRVDHTEMEDCRWFTRQEVRTMLASEGAGVLHGPPRIAIARALIETWANDGK